MNAQMTHECFVALTRPPMKWGTPLSFLFINLMAHLLFYIILSAKCGVPFYAFIVSFGLSQMAGILACQYDVRWFDLLLGKFSFKCPNKATWGCESYAPY
jgi:type IV secretory pathway VirB3-like protein